MKRSYLIALATLLVATLFLFLLGPGLDWFDTPELIQAAFFLDLTHPPGQPLFVLLGKMATLLPCGSIPFRLSLFSALCVALAIGLVFTLDAKRTLGFLILGIAALLALSPAVALQAVRGEVYGLHLLMGMLLVSLTAYFSAARSYRGAYLVLFLLGISLGNHHFLVGLLLPMLALWWWPAWRAMKPRLPQLLWGILFLLSGLSVYLFLPIRSAAQPPTIFGWGEAEQWQGLWQFIRGRDFGIYFLWPWDHPDLLRQALTVLGIFTVATLLVALPWVVRHRPLPIVALWLGVLSCFAAYTIKIFYPQNPDALGYLAIIPLLIWTSLQLYLQELPKAFAVLLITLTLLFTSLQWRLSAHPLNRQTQKLVESYALDLEHHAPLQSLVILSSDHALFPLSYRQNVERQRPDLAIFSPNMTGAKWYRDYLAGRHGDLKVSLKPGKLMPQLIQDNPERPVIAEFADLFEPLFVAQPRLKSSVSPWWLWYRLDADHLGADHQGKAAQSATELEASLFLQEFQQAPERYRMTGAQIRQQLLAARAHYWYARHDYPRTIATQQSAIDSRAQATLKKPPSACKALPAALRLPIRQATFPAFISDHQREMLQLVRYWLECDELEAGNEVAGEMLKFRNPNGALMVAEYLWVQKGVPRQALEKLLPLTEQLPGEPLLWSALGILAMELKDLALAREWFELALRLDPRQTEVRGYLKNLKARR